MKLNCRPGDLAVIVSSSADNEGKIVRVLSRAYHGVYDRNRVVDKSPAWFIEPPLVGWDGATANMALDSQLRPIRDNDGEDETLQWVDVPSKQTA